MNKDTPPEALVRALLDRFFGGHETSILEQLVGAEFVDHGAHSQQPPGAAGLVWLNDMLHDICPALRIEIEALAAVNDTVVVRSAMVGTLDDGDPLEERSITWFRCADGLIVERWVGAMR